MRCGSSCSRSGLATALERFAEAVRAPEKQQLWATEKELFPMFTMPLESFLAIHEVSSHEVSLEQGLLVEYTLDKGEAIFVSHQWLAFQHPDPDGRKLKVMQEAFRNLLAGISQLSVHIATEVHFGRPSVDYVTSMRTKPQFIWYLGEFQ